MNNEYKVHMHTQSMLIGVERLTVKLAEKAPPKFITV